MYNSRKFVWPEYPFMKLCKFPKKSLPVQTIPLLPASRVLLELWNTFCYHLLSVLVIYLAFIATFGSYCTGTSFVVRLVISILTINMAALLGTRYEHATDYIIMFNKYLQCLDDELHPKAKYIKIKLIYWNYVVPKLFTGV